LKSSPGDRVVLHAPGKTEPLDILDVEYVTLPMEPFREPPGAEAATRTQVPNAKSQLPTSKNNSQPSEHLDDCRPPDRQVRRRPG
jgi:hypothetical protein